MLDARSWLEKDSAAGILCSRGPDEVLEGLEVICCRLLQTKYIGANNERDDCQNECE